MIWIWKNESEILRIHFGESEIRAKRIRKNESEIESKTVLRIHSIHFFFFKKKHLRT